MSAQQHRTGLTASPAEAANHSAVADPRPRRTPWLAIREPISRSRTLFLGIAVWVLFFAVWTLVTSLQLTPPLLLPSPQKVVATLYDLLVNGQFVNDIGISVARIVVSFSLACLVAVPLGICMGTFKSIEAFVNPFVSAWRYLPAPSFIPLLLMWFGTGETSKLVLLFIGVVFFLVTLIMDHTRSVRQELIETAMTLGGNRRQILWTVIVPAVLPDVVTAMRQMLAVSWTYLVIAEIMAPTTGIGAMMMRAKRFLVTPKILAGIVVIGILGLCFDFAFRKAHHWLFSYQY